MKSKSMIFKEVIMTENVWKIKKQETNKHRSIIEFTTFLLNRCLP